MTHHFRQTFLLVIAALCAGAAIAQPYPAKPVRIVVAGTPGGSDDFVARLVATQLGEILKQSFVIENRPGAGGVIAQTLVLKSAPDGYTLLLAGGSMAGAKFVNASVTYDVLRDFTPISLLEASPFALIVHPSLPARDVKELIALARSRPGKVTYGTPGAGQASYWSVLLFNTMAGLQAVEVPYKSVTDAANDLMAGRIDYMFAPVPTLPPRDKARVLGVTTRVRSEMIPDAATIDAAGLPGYDMPSWRAIMGPAGMSRDVVELLNKAIGQTLANPEVRERFAKAGSVAIASSPAELRKRYEDWIAIFGKIARDTGVKPQ